LDIRLLTPPDRDWVRRKIIETWGAETVVVHETVYHPAELPGFIAEIDGEIVGLLTYAIQGEACEIVTLNSWRESVGVGTALIAAVHVNAIERNRRLKPEIPLTGMDGIPIRDEIELEMVLNGKPDD